MNDPSFDVDHPFKTSGLKWTVQMDVSGAKADGHLHHSSFRSSDQTFMGHSTYDRPL